MPTDLVAFLRQHSEAVVAEATAAVGRAHLAHYEASGQEATRSRLRRLLELVIQCIGERTLAPVETWADGLARERFAGGFDLREVQTAFNVLEESLWKRVVDQMPRADLPEALGLVSTVLGAGKDHLARTYVSLAAERQVPSLDLGALFRGVSPGA